MPDVVDSDEDGKDARAEVEAVLFPAFLKVRDFVPTDTPIVDSKAELGVAAQNSACGEEWVSATEGGLVIGVAFVFLVASGVGDGVSLEENGAPFFEGDFWRGGLSSGGGEERGSGGEGGGTDELASIERSVFHVEAGSIRREMRKNFEGLEVEHGKGGDAVVDEVHPNGDPQASGEFAGQPEEEAEDEDVADDHDGVLQVEGRPAK